jgi:RecB family exonuclease
MITPRRTRLVRVPDLHAFRRAIDALAPSAQAVVVSTRAAAALLRRRLPGPQPPHAAPEIVTRGELYESLRRRLAAPPRALTPLERDALAQAAAQQCAKEEPELAFRLRAGLVAEMLRFYDQLKRQSQAVRRFEELITDALAGAVDDRGAARLLVQTRFLGAAFREYERRVRETGACDEHTLRERLVTEVAAAPLRSALITVGDWIAEPDGLYVADFDLLARMPALEAIDLVCTERMLGSGLHERIHSWWPGLEECEAADVIGTTERIRPVLITPAPGEPAERWFTFRDREDELSAAADRFLAHDPHEAAVVFKHPLPYLYLAPDTLGAAAVPYETFDALPLAAEPTAAALDAVLDAVESGFTRTSLVALLRAPHFSFAHEGARLSRRDISALDAALSRARYLGDIVRLEALAGEGARGVPALDVALALARELAPLADPAAASTQVRRLAAFLAAHFVELEAAGEGVPAGAGAADAFAARETTVRRALFDLLAQLADACETFHDPEWTIADLASTVRRWISEHTFVLDAQPLTGPGLRLVDDRAAAYGNFDEIAVVGLIEHEWPERPRRNIFYGAPLLKALGWPSEKDRRGASEARFLDLISSARSHVTLSTFTLENETLVARSAQLDDVAGARLSSVPVEGASNARPAPVAPPADDPAYHGRIGALASRPWSVSALETYLGCPFKFFAQHVLRLQEEPEDEEVMDPRRQGQFVHDVFEKFFAEWQSRGRGSITPANLADARELFAEVAERALARLPEAEAGLERTRLLGSPAAAGLGEAVFRMEAERDAGVVARLLEERLDGSFEITTGEGVRRVTLRGKADRIDLLDDGTFRVIDYKLGWPPNKARALQLPIYALCARQKLAARDGRQWALGEAVYLAFKGPRRVVPLFADPRDRDEALAKAQQRLADTIDAIERGEFPPAPDDVFRCETCSFAAVCRKDYV